MATEVMYAVQDVYAVTDDEVRPLCLCRWWRYPATGPGCLVQAAFLELLKDFALFDQYRLALKVKLL